MEPKDGDTCRSSPTRLHKTLDLAQVLKRFLNHTENLHLIKFASYAVEEAKSSFNIY